MRTQQRAILREIDRLQAEALELRAAEESRLERIRELLEALEIGGTDDSSESSSTEETEAPSVAPEEETNTVLQEGDRVKVLTGLDRDRIGILDEDLGLTNKGKTKWRIRFPNGSTTWRIAENLAREADQPES